MLVLAIAGSNALIKSSKISKVILESKRTINDVKVFKSKYHSLPGDMPDASHYFYGDNTRCQYFLGQFNCNGNGDGFIDIGNEINTAWEHLSLSRIDEKISTELTFNPVDGLITIYKIPTLDYESQKIFKILTQKHLILTSMNNVTSGFSTLETLGGSTIPIYDIIPSELAAIIDQKMDDGKPHSGDVQVSTNSGGSIKCSDNGEYVYDGAGCSVAITLPGEENIFIDGSRL